MRVFRPLLALALLLPLPGMAAEQVKINIAWEYVDFSQKMTLHEVKGRPRLWQMESVKSVDEAPIGAAITESSFLIAPGEEKRFVLVLHNDSDETRYFFAAPHTATPAAYALGFMFKCLCISKAYTVGPHETWYRVVKFKLFDGFVGEELTLTHGVIGIDEERARSFSSEDEVKEF